MKATVTTSSLAAATAWVSRIVPGRPPSPILGGVLVEVTESTDRDEVSLSAFDYETAGVARLGPGLLSMDEPGRVLVSGRLLADIVKTLGKGDAPVRLESEGGGRMAVVAGRSRWDLPELAVEDYPTLPTEGDQVGTVTAKELERAAERVAAVPNGDDVKALGGIAMTAEAGGPLVLAATDRYRLAVVEVPWTSSSELPQVLLPAEVLRHAASAVHGATGPVGLHVTGGTVGFTTEERTLVGRLLAEEFPRWRLLDVTPESPKHVFTSSSVVAAADLRALVARAAVMLEQSEALALRFGPEGIEASASGDLGAAEHVADVIAHDGDPVEQHLNPGYLRDMLDGVDADVVRLDLPTTYRPVLGRPAAEDGSVIGGYRHSVMPVRNPAGGAA